MYKVVKTLKELPVFNPELPTFADIETESKYVGCRLIQLYQPEAADLVYVIDTDIIDLEEAKNFIKPLWTVWHGAAYDFGTLNMTTEKFDDTLYLARSAYPEWQQFTLDNVVSKLGWNNLYDGLDKKALQKSGFMKGAYLSDRQLRYAATDVIALSKIWQNKRIQATRELLAYKVDILNLKYAIEYQQNGLVIDRASVRKELDELEPKIEANYIELNGLNPNSPKQVTEYLGTESSSKDVLIKLIADGSNPEKARMAKLVYEQRRLLKRRTLLNSYNFPYVVTRFNPAGAATGRFTATGGDIPNGINSQQLPRALQYLFKQDTTSETTPEHLKGRFPNGSVVIHADYSTAELRAGCSIMKDANMYIELKEKKDLHKIAATLAIGGKPEDIDKEGRQKGKAISFGFIFGMSAPSFVEYAFVNYGVIFTQEEAKQIKANYQRKYPGITRYAHKWWNDYKTEFVTTPLGRRNKARLGTDAINFATQGCIAETTKLAIHYLCKKYPEATKYIFNVVHDAIDLRVPKGEENEWATRLVVAMKKGWVEMCKRPMLHFKDIPMPVEVEYNDYSSGKPIKTISER